MTSRENKVDRISETRTKIAKTSFLNERSFPNKRLKENAITRRRKMSLTYIVGER
jgi:hypothetical protein